MIILLYILFVFAIISNTISALFYVKSANRKAHYTMIEIKALRQLRDKLENLLKEASEKKWNSMITLNN